MRSWNKDIGLCPAKRLFWRPSGALLLLLGFLFAGCGGIQSAFEPAGHDARQILNLFWFMTAAGTVVWLIVVGLTLYALIIRPGTHSRLGAKLLIIGGGAVFPSIVLVVLLSFGLSMLPGMIAPAPEGSLRMEVVGEQWWWRVRYPTPDGGTVELANEIRLPVGEATEIRLHSNDVIHALWVPALHGKIDMIPGRVNRIVLRPDATGTFRGACAEYCGGPHALMNFYVVVMEKEAFETWLRNQARPASQPQAPPARRGSELFLASGCGGCHTIRGTPAEGRIAPDLTHVGSRVSIGAGIFPNDPESFFRWIGHTRTVKPEVHMPSFGMLPAEDLRALAEYLNELE